MELIRFETKLKFAKKSRVVTPAYSVLKALTDKEPPEEQRPKEPGVLIRNEQQKHAVRWDYDECGILYEDTAEHNNCIKDTVRVLDMINHVAPITQINWRELIIYWILPTPKYNFKSLELKYRENFIKPSAIFHRCVDSSVAIDMKYDDCILHHASGAMNITQLQSDYKIFKMKEQQAKLFIFLETSISNGKMIEYSSKDLREFLEKSFEKCNSHANEFQKEMEAIL